MIGDSLENLGRGFGLAAVGDASIIQTAVATSFASAVIPIAAPKPSNIIVVFTDVRISGGPPTWDPPDGTWNRFTRQSMNGDIGNGVLDGAWKIAAGNEGPNINLTIGGSVSGRNVFVEIAGPTGGLDSVAYQTNANTHVNADSIALAPVAARVAVIACIACEIGGVFHAGAPCLELDQGAVNGGQAPQILTEWAKKVSGVTNITATCDASVGEWAAIVAGFPLP